MITIVCIRATILLSLLSVAMVVGPLRADRRHPRLPLESAGLAETRTAQTIARGLTYTRIERGHTSVADYYTVFIFEPTRADVEALSPRPLANGFQPRIEKQLILFRPIFGAIIEPGASRPLLASNGAVTQIRSVRGGTIPVGGAVLVGTGNGAAWLLRHARVGTVVDIQIRIFREHGHRVELHADDGIMNGGPRLLRKGTLDITATAEGFVYPENGEFYYRFGGRRNPRTVAGVTEAGHSLLVAVDGPLPGSVLERASSRARRSCGCSGPRRP